MPSREHWENVYAAKSSDEVSWYQRHPARSLELITSTGISPAAKILDVGGGASVLVDKLLALDFANVTVLDISAKALATAQARLGPTSAAVNWIEGDILAVTLPNSSFDLWHDRAVFHFLTSAEERKKYMQIALNALKPGGYAVIATFADDGPTQCSGLPVVRYSPEQLHAEFGESFSLLRSDREVHMTPRGNEQRFIYCLFQRT